MLSISTTAEPEPPSVAVTDAARAAYDREVEEPWLPVGADEIVVGMLVENPVILATPTVPLSELLTDAGLERRGIKFAHDDSVWRAAKSRARLHAVFERLDEDRRKRAAGVLTAFDASEREAGALHRALTALADHQILSAVTDLLLDLDDDVDRLDEVDRFAADLFGAARRPRDVAPARWLMAVISERRRDPLVGLAYLELAVKADPEFLPAVDRLAWYLSDRGDALAAVRLWRSMGVSEADSADLRGAVPFTETVAVSLGRNEACWCGSGRKFKHCHLGQPEKFELPDRVGWLCRKAVAYLERRGGVTLEQVYELAVVRADGDDSEEAIDEAFADPMVMDVALHEGGWFDRFIEERGALLPDDEAMLARAWTFVDRTLYEVVETEPGKSMTVRDLRSAELVEVRERTFSRQARVGQVLCARAVPDGENAQFIGGIFGVVGEEKDLLDLLDTSVNGTQVLEWLGGEKLPAAAGHAGGRGHARPASHARDPSPGTAREVLDRVYDPKGEGQWTESHELENGETILRCHLIELHGRPDHSRDLERASGRARLSACCLPRSTGSGWSPTNAVRPRPARSSSGSSPSAADVHGGPMQSRRDSAGSSPNGNGPGATRRSPHLAGSRPARRQPTRSAVRHSIGCWVSTAPTSTPTPIPSWSHSIPIVCVGCSAVSLSSLGKPSGANFDVPAQRSPFPWCRCGSGANRSRAGTPQFALFLVACCTKWPESARCTVLHGARVGISRSQPRWLRKGRHSDGFLRRS